MRATLIATLGRKGGGGGGQAQRSHARAGDKEKKGGRANCRGCSFFCRDREGGNRASGRVESFLWTGGVTFVGRLRPFRIGREKSAGESESFSIAKRGGNATLLLIFFERKEKRGVARYPDQERGKGRKEIQYPADRRA